MSAAASFSHRVQITRRGRETTLLELVRVVAEVTDDEREVVATVLHMLRSGEVCLCGNFRGASVDELT